MMGIEQKPGHRQQIEGPANRKKILSERLHKMWQDGERSKFGPDFTRVKILGEFWEIKDGEKIKKKKGWYNESDIGKKVEPIEGTEEFRQDIFNTDFENLHPFWQADNIMAADVDYDAVAKIALENPTKNLLDPELVELGSAEIHEKFLKRRKESGAWIPEGQDKPYSELSDGSVDKEDNEKERDRIHYRLAVEVYQQYTGKYNDR